jgi:F-type H+-transporting ATPase subunit b
VVLLAFIAVHRGAGLLQGAGDGRRHARQARRRHPAELDEARRLREEAQTILASYERKQREVVEEQAERIVTQARHRGRDRRGGRPRPNLAGVDRTASRRRPKSRSPRAEAKAVRAVSDRAVEVAVAAAGEIIASRMAVADADSLIDASIEEVTARLH